MSTPAVYRNDSRSTETLFRALFENAAVGIAVFDAAGHFLEVNPRLCQMLGCTAEEVLGCTREMLTHPDDWSSNRHLVDELSRGERAEVSVEERICRANNTWLWVRINMTSLDGASREVRLMAVVEDITERKRIEEDLRRHRDNLQELVQERTMEVLEANSRLRHAERMAVFGMLSAGLGHDMANLLVPVHFRLDALTRMDLSEEAHDHLIAIKSSAEYLQKLSGGLRLLAADPGDTARGGSTNLEAWWADTRGILRTVLPGSVSLDALLPADTWVGISRPGLMQAVFNLVQNAGESLRDRTAGSVVVSARADGEYVNVSITDNGPGMSDDVRLRCFEPFFTTKHRYISTGLGLAIVYGLVKEAGGEIDVQSEPGRGTTFTLRLTRSSAPDAVTDTPRRPAVVTVEDARLRAIFVVELRALRYEVAFEAGAASLVPDLVVADRWPLERAAGTRLVLFADSTETPSSAVMLGSKPAVQAIRNALRELTAA